MKTINPATGQVTQEYNEHTPDEVQAKLARAAAAFEAWRMVGMDARATHMRTLAKLLKQNKDRHARQMTEEMGKPLKEAKGEVEKCAWVCEYYADNAAAFLADKEIHTEASRSFITYHPLGAVLAVMPWNFPLWQVFRFAVPSLMAGNVGVLKHASNVCGTALAIEKLFLDAGFPEGVFTTLLIGSDKVEEVIKSNVIKAVTLTGSTQAGSAVAALAGKFLKKTVLELGGSDPYVILADADIEAAAEACVTSRLQNCGQSCIAAKRFIAVEPVYDAFKEAIIEKLKARKVGDPMQEGTDLGPMSSVKLRDELHVQVTKSVEQGATLEFGGAVPECEGAYYPVTLLTDIKPGMAAFDEELFGPVAVLVKAKDEEEAISLANTTPFGLGSAIFTADIKHGETLAKAQLHAGACFVNRFVASDPRLPFGGIGNSGYGRELSEVGIHEFVNIKTISVA